MAITAEACELEAILALRDMYRLEMACQVIHDFIHSRVGWTREYLLRIDGEQGGYGSVAIGGPWRDAPALHEFSSPALTA